MYGKSIPRDKLEDEVGEILRGLQPTRGLIKLATAMFRHAWDVRRSQAADALAAGQRKIDVLETEIEKTLDRLMNTDSGAVIRRFEQRITELEKQKALLAEKQVQRPEPKGVFEEKLELSLQFLASPWKLWETGDITLRRIVLKLALADRVYYCRNRGARTPDFAFPFKALTALDRTGCPNGAGRGT